MKRLCGLGLCLAWMLCMCGCGKGVLRPVQPALPDEWTCAVRLTAGDTEFTADWTLTHGESLFVLRQPQNIAGVTVRCTAEGAQMEADGVTAPLPDTSPFAQIAASYRTLQTAVPEGTLTAHGWLLDLKATDGFTALQDKDSGNLTRISIPSQQITAVLSFETAES